MREGRGGEEGREEGGGGEGVIGKKRRGGWFEQKDIIWSRSNTFGYKPYIYICSKQNFVQQIR